MTNTNETNTVANVNKRGRKPIFENRENVIDSLVAIRDNDEANMPSRRSILQLVEMGHVEATERERAVGEDGKKQRGRAGTDYALTGKARSWLALMLRNRDAAAVKAKAAERVALVAAIAAADQAAVDARAALEAFDAEAQEEANADAETEQQLTAQETAGDETQDEPAQEETTEA